MGFLREKCQRDERAGGDDQQDDKDWKRPSQTGFWFRRDRGGLREGNAHSIQFLLGLAGAFERIVKEAHIYFKLRVDVAIELANGAAHHVVTDAFGLFHKSGQERFVAQGVDEPGHAVAVTENPP